MPPWLIFLFLVAMAMALAYQLISRRCGWRVLVYWAFALLGLIGFEVLAELAGWSFTRMGDVRLAPDIFGGMLAIGLLWFLGL